MWPVGSFWKTNKRTSHKAKTAGGTPGAKDDSAYAVSKDCSKNYTWLVDSGALSYMTWNQQLLVN